MPSSVSSASSTASSQKRQSDAIVSLNLLLKSTPLPTVSSLQEITPSLLVDLYEVLFLVKLPYSTPRDLSPESQLRNIRILIGTIAHNVLQMDLSFIDPRKICDGDERALLEFLKIFIGVANLRRIYPAGARNVNPGSLRQISNTTAPSGGGSGGGNAARPKSLVAANNTTQHLTIAVKDDKQRDDIDVSQHEVDGSEIQTAASTAGSEVYDDNRSEGMCSPGRSDVAYNQINGTRDMEEDEEERAEESNVEPFVEETVTATLDNKGLEEEEVAATNGQTQDEPDEADCTVMTIASEATSIAPDVMAQLNERVALQAARIRNLGRTENQTEKYNPSVVEEKEEKQTPRKKSPKPALEVPSLMETPKPPQINSPQPESTPLPDSQSSSDEGSVRLIIDEDISESKQEAQDHRNGAHIREEGDDDEEETEEEEAVATLSTRSPSLRDQPRRSFTSSPSKMDPRYLSPEKPGIIAFDTSPSATMAYKAELRASFSEDLQRDSEASSFAWDPTPPDVQTRPLMEFNSFYSTANNTAEQTTMMGRENEAAVSLDFAAMANGLRIFHGRDERSDDEAIEDDLTEDERNEGEHGEDKSVDDEYEEDNDRRRDDTYEYEESERADESHVDESQGDFEPMEEKEKDGAKAAVPGKSFIPVPSKQGKSTTGSQSRNPSDKKELLRFFSGQRPLVYRKSFQKASPSPVAKPSTSKLPTRVNGNSSTRSTSPEKATNQVDVYHDDEHHDSVLDEGERDHKSIVDTEEKKHESMMDAEENEYESVIYPEEEENDDLDGAAVIAEHREDEVQRAPSLKPPSSPTELVQEDLETPKDGVKSSTPVLSPEDTISASVMPDSSPTPMPRSRPTTATRPAADNGTLPSLTTLFGPPQSPEISALPPMPDDPTAAGIEIERIPSSPSSVATSEMSVSTVGWVDSPHTAALKRKRREAMAAMHEGMDVKVGSKIAKLAIDYGSWTPRASPAVSRTASSMRRHNGLGVTGEGGEDDHEMDGHVHMQSYGSDDEEEDDDGDGDEDGEEGIARLEAELRILSDISKRESEKQTGLFRMLMRSRHL